jgi:hypothetical protein
MSAKLVEAALPDAPGWWIRELNGWINIHKIVRMSFGVDDAAVSIAGCVESRWYGPIALPWEAP